MMPQTSRISQTCEIQSDNCKLLKVSQGHQSFSLSFSCLKGEADHRLYAFGFRDKVGELLANTDFISVCQQHFTAKAVEEIDELLSITKG